MKFLVIKLAGFNKAILQAAERHFVSTAQVTEAYAKCSGAISLNGWHEARLCSRLADDWLELAVRFHRRRSGIRLVRDAMSHDILRALKEASIKVGSSTCETPALQLRGATQPFGSV